MSKELEALNKIQHDFGQLKGRELVSCYETIFNALKRLESIDNANPSEALECLEKVYSRLPQWDLSRNIDQCNIIKQALLKAQEPKQYLKWEDLEFTNEVKEMKVKLGDNTYEIEYYICNALGLHQPVVILKTSDFIAITIEQFFNDLHLERVEE